MVKVTVMTTIGTLSSAKNTPSIDASGPLKPPLNSAHRQHDRTKRQAEATAKPANDTH